MTLTEFLLARIAEDESVARDAGDGGPVAHGRRSELSRAWDRDYGPEVGTVEIDSARVLVECESKRRIIGERNDDEPPWIVLRHMAMPYADHPEYRDEWKP